MQYFLTYRFYLHCKKERNVHLAAFVMHCMSLLHNATSLWIQRVVKSCFWSSVPDNHSMHSYTLLSGVATQAAKLIWKTFPSSYTHRHSHIAVVFHTTVLFCSHWAAQLELGSVNSLLCNLRLLLGRMEESFGSNTEYTYAMVPCLG